MASINWAKTYIKEINSCLNTFYLMMRCKRVEVLYDMLSPNLQQFTLMESYQAKFREVFLFHREIIGFYVHHLTAINPILLEAIVLIGLKPMDEQEGQDELRYKIYRFRFINIYKHWYIDDVYLDNDFQCTNFN